MNAFISIVFSLLSLYDIQFLTNDGALKRFNIYAGKKILLVNIATNSNRVRQLSELKQLQDQYRDSLVVLGFPSNSFGNEPRSNEEILHFCISEYQINFPLASKVDVCGYDKATVFTWLSDVTMNGSMNAPAKSDFQKYLLDKNGNLIAVFSGSVSPLDSTVISAINE